MRFKLTLGIAVIGLVAVALPLWAHHSHGNYTQQTKDMEGVVTEVHALNPHSWVYVNVTDASGKTELWALEGGGARGLQELAKEGKGLKAGDKVKVRVHVLRDGSNGALLGFIKHPDGAVRNYDSGASLVTDKIEGF